MTDQDPTPKMSIDVNQSLEQLQKQLKEQSAVIVKQNEMLKDMQNRMAEFEKVQTAVPAAAPQEAPAPKESAQDAAYHAMLREMGIKED